jgi:hypothetical protein
LQLYALGLARQPNRFAQTRRQDCWTRCALQKVCMSSSCFTTRTPTFSNYRAEALVTEIGSPGYRMPMHTVQSCISMQHCLLGTTDLVTEVISPHACIRCASCMHAATASCTTVHTWVRHDIAQPIAALPPSSCTGPVHSPIPCCRNSSRRRRSQLVRVTYRVNATPLLIIE